MLEEFFQINVLRGATGESVLTSIGSYLILQALSDSLN